MSDRLEKFLTREKKFQNWDIWRNVCGARLEHRQERKRAVALIFSEMTLGSGERIEKTNANEYFWIVRNQHVSLTTKKQGLHEFVQNLFQIS